MENILVLVLAAGLGKRMRDPSTPKVLFEAGGKPLILHVLEMASGLAPQKLVVVTGYKKEAVEATIHTWTKANTKTQIQFAHQAEQKGTGDAARAALDHLKDFVGSVVILYGDMPLLRTETLTSLLTLHKESKATISLLSTTNPNLNSFGRVVRSDDGKFVSKIVEAKDCSPQELSIAEKNAGIYVVDSAFLGPALKELTNKNAQGEYYLTDIISKASHEGQTVIAMSAQDSEEVLGVNDLWDIHTVDQALNARRVKQFITTGVKVLDHRSLWIDPSVTIDAGVTIGPMVQLKGATKIAPGVVIEGNCLMQDCVVEAGAHIKLGVRAEKSHIGKSAMVGPFAHLREGSELGPEVKIGNFVETKKAILAKGAKASHLTYLGDCNVGADANIGAGTITCNYDGFQKHQTVIGKGAFIGSNSVLIAPVTIDDGAYIGAGSAISKNIEKDALAFTRAPLKVKSGWVKSRKN